MNLRVTRDGNNVVVRCKESGLSESESIVPTVGRIITAGTHATDEARELAYATAAACCTARIYERRSRD